MKWHWNSFCAGLVASSQRCRHPYYTLDDYSFLLTKARCVSTEKENWLNQPGRQFIVVGGDVVFKRGPSEATLQLIDE